MNKKVILWGTGGGYEKILNQILFETAKGNISVEALVCRKEDIYCPRRDSFPIITKEELKGTDFDYLVITSQDCFAEIKKEAMDFGIPERIIIDGSVFSLPLFDFGRYCQLIENPVTILSDDCWGGYVYHRLKLPFSSPLINILWDESEYLEFIQDPIFYLGTELQVVREGDFKKGLAPVAQLGNAERNVKLRLIHNTSFAQAKEQWDRRIKRVNTGNLFVKIGIGKLWGEWQHIFSDVPYKKISFCSEECASDYNFFTERFEWRQKKPPRAETYIYKDYMRLNYFLSIDLLKLLVDGKGYSREI